MQIEYNLGEMEDFKADLTNLIEDKKEELGFTDAVVLCIGNPKIYYDRVGPKVGSAIREGDSGITVIGTMDKPLNVADMDRRRNELSEMHKDKLVIVIDACICMGSNNAGKICISDLPVVPAFANTKRKLPPIGHISIVAYTAYVKENYDKMFANLPIDKITNIIEVLSNAIIDIL